MSLDKTKRGIVIPDTSLKEKRLKQKIIKMLIKTEPKNTPHIASFLFFTLFIATIKEGTMDKKL